MRPIYETGDDLSREREVAELLANKWGLTARKLPSRYSMDYALCSGDEVERWLEVKCRTNAADAYATYMLSLAKYLGLLDYQNRTGIIGLLAVGWTDSVGVLRVPARHTISIGGRTDRGDSQDVEPCVMIPVELFHKTSWP